MQLNIRSLAQKTYKALPSSGFSWHKAEHAAGVLETIRDAAVISGDKKAESIASTALKSESLMDGVDKMQNNWRTDRVRAAGYSAALDTLRGSMNAPLDVLLAKTAKNALNREVHMSDENKLKISENYGEEIDRVNNTEEFSGLANPNDFQSKFNELAGAPSILSTAESYLTDVIHNHRGMDGEYHTNRTI